MGDTEDFKRLMNHFLKGTIKHFYSDFKKGTNTKFCSYIEENINQYNRGSSKNYTLLYAAVKLQDVPVLKKLLEIPSLNVNKGCREETPLMLACRLPKSEIVSLLLSHPRIDVNRSSRTIHPAEISSGTTGATALFYAVNWHIPETVKLLLERADLEIDKGTRDGDSPLVEAVKSYLNTLKEQDELERAFVYELIVNHGCKPDECDPKSHTTHEGYRTKFVERQLERNRTLYECLVMLIADQRVKDLDRVYTICCDYKLGIEKSIEEIKNLGKNKREYVTPRETVLSRLNEVLELLKQRNPTYDSVYDYSVEANTQYEASFHAEINKVCTMFDDNRCLEYYWVSYIFDRIKEAYIVKNRDVNTGQIYSFQHSWSERWLTHHEHTTLLIEACEQGNLERVNEHLADPKILVNKVNRYQEAPFHAAVKSGNLDIVRRLLQMPGLNPNLVNGKGETGLSLACKSVQLEIIQEILKHPAVKIYTYRKAVQNILTPLLVLHGENENTEQFEIILELFLTEIQKTAKQHHPNNRIFKKILQDCLLKACEIGILPYIEKFLAAGARINQYGRNHTKPLQAAIRAGHLEIVKYITALPKLYVWSTNSEWQCDELQIAASCKNHEIFIFLIEKWNKSFSDNELVEINKALSKNMYYHNLNSRNVEGNKTAFLGKHVMKKLYLRYLAQINTMGRLKDGRPFPYLPPELYKNIAEFLVEPKPPKQKPSPEDAIEWEERELVTEWRNGSLYYRDTLTNTHFQQNREGYLEEAQLSR